MIRIRRYSTDVRDSRGRAFPPVSWYSVVCDTPKCKVETKPEPGEADDWETSSADARAINDGWVHVYQGHVRGHACPKHKGVA